MPNSSSGEVLGTHGATAGPTDLPLWRIRTLHMSDIAHALRSGWDDFSAVPSHGLMLVVIYPIIGIVAARLVLGYAILPLLFPLAAGFALLGPFFALGLYELSRRRERGKSVSASDALSVFRRQGIGPMLGLGAMLLILFLVWIAVAQSIYVATFGYAAAAGIPDFLGRVLTTEAGARLILFGCGAGFLFALVTLALTVVAFPMMLDRGVGISVAMQTSLRVTARNPLVVGAWGLAVAALLILGTIPFFAGLIVVLPLLGHASWHFYRRAVV